MRLAVESIFEPMSPEQPSNSTFTAVDARIATAAELDATSALIARAFYNDPTWSWAFPDDSKRLGQHKPFWRIFVNRAIEHRSAWVVDKFASASIWVPPGKPEMTEQDELELDALLARMVPKRADLILDAFELFEEAHPREEEHWSLSLLGTDPDARGRGTGLGLLARNLEMIDEQGLPAYLEASNPANVALYERLGFETVGGFQLPDGGPFVTTMWREAVSQ
jgi:GNAT superfamily N-acetyltransferase